MKNRIVIIILVCLLIGTVSCAKAPTWEEQYALGVRYLSEGNYEEAIIAFTAAIEIDPKQAITYASRGDVYFSMEDYEKAIADYNEALKIDPKQANVYASRGDAYFSMEDYEKAAADYNEALIIDPSLDIKTKLEEAEKKQLLKVLAPSVCNLNLPMTLDHIVLGQSTIEAAKGTYKSYPYALSNLMDDGACDTVYVCFGMNDTPIPQGHKEMEFGFGFFGPPGGVVENMVVQQPGIVALGGLQVGDSSEDVLDFFGFPEVAPQTSLSWSLNNGGMLNYSWEGNDSFTFDYKYEEKNAIVTVDNGCLYRVLLKSETS